MLAENAFPLALAGVLATALAALSPGLFVADSWMTLASGREVIRHGLPSTDQLTIWSLGERWLDQQWLAQVGWYGVAASTGLAGVATVAVVAVVAAWGSAMAAARLLGASARSTFLVAAPCLFVAPWAWQIRAQTFALPLFVCTLWLAADHVRLPSRRIVAALPLLLLWANLHGSVLLGATLVSIAAAGVAIRERRIGARWIVVAPGAWLCALLTPYGTEIVDYYRLLLVDPPFADAITEWQRTRPTGITLVFFGVGVGLVALVIWKWRRLSWFELVALAITLAGALQAVRGVVWFTLAAVVICPNALDGVFRSRDTVRSTRANLVVALSLTATAFVALVASATRGDSWFERDWPNGAVPAVQAAGADATVFASDRHADWLLWRIPDLRGRLAYDVRFELYTRDQITSLIRFTYERGDAWKSPADRYDVVVLDASDRPSHVHDFSGEPGSSVSFADDRVVVVERR